jgi:hypothetical protein
MVEAHEEIGPKKWMVKVRFTTGWACIVWAILWMMSLVFLGFTIGVAWSK